MPSKIAQARAGANDQPLSGNGGHSQLLNDLLKQTQQAKMSPVQPPVTQQQQAVKDEELAALTQILDEVETTKPEPTANAAAELDELNKMLDQIEAQALATPNKEAAPTLTNPENQTENQAEKSPEVGPEAPPTPEVKVAPEIPAQVEAAKEVAEKQEIAKLEEQLASLAEQSKENPRPSIVQNANVPAVNAPGWTDDKIMVELPVTEKQLKRGESLPPSSGLKWLAEITKKLQKRFKGRTVYANE